MQGKDRQIIIKNLNVLLYKHTMAETYHCKLYKNVHAHKLLNREYCRSPNK